MGVKRAMDKVLAIARDKPGSIFTYGPLIHNRQAVELLEGRGIRAATSFDGVQQGTVLLRTHGVPPDTVAQLQAAGLEVEDGTCPHVLRGQKSIARRSAEGYHVVIVGDRDHDEVAGLAGHAAGPCHIIASAEEARTVPLGEKVLVVAQTTFNEAQFCDIVGLLRARKPDIEVVHSICTATSERQEEARQLARKVDAMVVVGGLHSANTRRLAEIAHATGTPTFHVETAADLDLEHIARYETVGVTAGASTPSWITSTVIDKLRRVGEKQSPWAHLRGLFARVVLDGNFFVAAAAAAVTYAAGKLMALQLARWQQASLMTAAFGYIFSAYSLGRMAESRAGEFGLTRRGAFYQAHPVSMAVISLVLSLVSFSLLAPLGPLAVALLAASYAMAGAYAILISPRKRLPSAFFRNIPASKDVLSAAGWTVATVFVPAVAAARGSVYSVSASAALVAAFVFGLAFIRSVMFDFSDVMADRLLGRDTLPALIGVRRARVVLGVLAVVLAIVLGAGAATGKIAALGYWMLLCPAYVLSYVLIPGRTITVSEHRTAVLADGGMMLAGLIALAYAIVT